MRRLLAGPRPLVNRSRLATAALILVAGAALGGCASGGTDAFAQAGSGATVAFDSIDGPPPQVFDRMVGMLDSESKLRNLSIVSRETPASYRVRSYLAAQVYRGRTSIAWVWDVYDRDQQRTLRLSGEEATTRSARDGAKDAWAGADDMVLRKIAQAGMSGLSAMLNGAVPDGASPAAPPRGGPAVAAADPGPAEVASALGFASR